MKTFLGIDETLLALEQFFKPTTKLRNELPKDTEMEALSIIERWYLAEDINVKAQETSQLNAWKKISKC